MREKILTSRSILWRPDYLKKSAWHEHIPFAFWLIEVHKPRVFVELGTHTGVSYFAFCQAVESLAIETSCFAVDTWKGDAHTGPYDGSVYQEVTNYNASKFSGFSTLIRCKFDDALQYFLDSSIDLLHIDGYHSLEAVQHDFETWLPKLSSKAIVLFHDTNVRKNNFEVFKFIHILKEKYPAFEFIHGNGLGVVCVGEDQNDTINILFSQKDDAIQETQKIFSRFGKDCAEMAANIELRNNEQKSLEFTTHLNAAQLVQAKLEKRLEIAIEELTATKLAQEELQKHLNDSTAQLNVATGENFKLTRELKDAIYKTSHNNFQLAVLRFSWKMQNRLAKYSILRRIWQYFFYKQQSDMAILNGSELFDAVWYLERYADVKKKNADPLQHFLKHGLDELRDPSPFFNSKEYIERYPGVKKLKMNPLVHYLRQNKKIYGYD